jgi:beta-glucanase (GH16 family)
MSWVESGRVSSCLISDCSGSDRVGFQVIWSRVIRVRIGSGFGLSDLGSFRVLGRSGSGRVGFWVVWSRVSDRSGPGRIRFRSIWLFKKNQIGSDSSRTSFSGWIGFCHLKINKKKIVINIEEDSGNIIWYEWKVLTFNPPYRLYKFIMCWSIENLTI